MPPNAPQEPAPAEIRCACGAMLARRVAGGIELLCRRCRRSVVVSDGSLDGAGAEVELCGPGSTAT